MIDGIPVFIFLWFLLFGAVCSATVVIAAGLWVTIKLFGSKPEAEQSWICEDDNCPVCSKGIRS